MFVLFNVVFQVVSILLIENVSFSILLYFYFCIFSRALPITGKVNILVMKLSILHKEVGRCNFPVFQSCQMLLVVFLVLFSIYIYIYIYLFF